MRAVTFAAWGLLAGAALALEVLSRRRTGGLVPIEEVVRLLRASRTGRAALVLSWMWLGWHLFAR